jgi:catechol 2,3-dioxygenase-like lactoylglutathione lyase family enzyme
MEQRLTFITLGVDDFDKMKLFYQNIFGWTPMLDRDGIVFFKLNGIVLSLFSNHELAEDAKVKNDGSGFKRFTLAICMKSEAEVDTIFKDLSQKGVRVTKAPEKVFWGGYSGYIADPENNLWEIAYNPFLGMDENGNVTMHQ